MAVPKEENPSKLTTHSTTGLISAAHKAGGSKLKRFVLLGSAVAVLNSFEDISKANKPYTEDDWNPVNNTLKWDCFHTYLFLQVTAEYAIEHGDVVSGYNASKRLAEEAAWKYMKEQNPQFDLTVINPEVI